MICIKIFSVKHSRNNLLAFYLFFIEDENVIHFLKPLVFNIDAFCYVHRFWDWKLLFNDNYLLFEISKEKYYSISSRMTRDGRTGEKGVLYKTEKRAFRKGMHKAKYLGKRQNFVFDDVINKLDKLVFIHNTINKFFVIASSYDNSVKFTNFKTLVASSLFLVPHSMQP